MSRAKKNTVDYFPHNCKHGKTLKIFESKFDNGYKFWFKLLELLGDSPDHYYDCKTEINRLWLVEYCLGIDNGGVTIAIEMLNYLATLKAIDPELWETDRIIWSQNFVDNLETVYNKRTTNIPERPNGNGNPSQIVIPERKSPETSHSGEKKPQRKGKDSKLNKTKNIPEDKSLREIVKSFYRYQYDNGSLPKYIKNKVDSENREDYFTFGVKVLDKLMRIDGYTIREVRVTLNLAVRDEFWSANLLSLSDRLRSRDKDGLHKFDKIYEKMKRASGSGSKHRKKEERLRNPVQNDRDGDGFKSLKSLINKNLED